jgi:hypothetical protein
MLHLQQEHFQIHLMFIAIALHTRRRITLLGNVTFTETQAIKAGHLILLEVMYSMWTQLQMPEHSKIVMFQYPVKGKHHD